MENESITTSQTDNPENLPDPDINTSSNQTSETNPQNKKTKPKKKPKKPPPKSKLTPEQIEKLKQSQNSLSPQFITYYKNLLDLDENEYSKFLNTLTQDLPIIFRINKIYTYCESLEEEITEYLIKNNEHFQPLLNRPKLNFLNNVYQLSSLNKNDPIDNYLKNLLTEENDYGILRQELVSMIPVNLVNIEDDQIIIDLCAAPGNKTLQVLEIMQEKARNKNTLPTGVIIANELDPKRAGNMAHLFKAHFPINVVITNNNAENFPIIENEKYKPDIVFCDVPCSGDGTMRKNKGLRKRWKIEYGLEDHFIQTKILEQGIKICKKGGKIVYSTCAINPLENEAVICHVLEKFKDEIEIVNCAKKLNEMGIKFKEGLVKWKVCIGVDKEKNEILWAEKFSDLKDTKSGLIKCSMFHDIYSYKNNHPGPLFSFTDPLNLRNCVRIYSHDNNSDCFFVAVIKKKENFGENNKNIEHITKEKKSDYSVPLNLSKNKTIGEDLDDFMEFLGMERDNPREENKDNQQKDFFETQINDNNENKINDKKEEDDLIFKKYVNLTNYTDSYNDLMKSYKFKNDILVKHLFCTRDSSNKILLFSKKLSEMITIFTKMNINIVRSGLVVFKKEREKIIQMKYRVTQYGAILMANYFGAQIIELCKPDLLKKLFETEDYSIPLTEVPEEEKKKIDECQNGSIVLLYDAFILVSRKGKGTLHLMLPKFPKGKVKKYIMRFIEE